MPAASSILRQASLGIHGISRGRQLVKHRRHSVLPAATNDMKQAEAEEYKLPRRIRFFSGSQRENLQAFRRQHAVERLGWIQAFCLAKENDLFVKVDEEFIKDNFNLHGLSTQVPNYDGALEEILDRYQGYFEEEARLLYGLIHRRYILTGKGIEAMLRKFNKAEFQKCPKSNCEGQTCLPVGFCDEPGVSALKFFCPRCEDLFAPIAEHHRGVDGAFFGPTFPHLLLLTNPVAPRPCIKEPSTSGYVPRIFGFRIHRPPPSAELV